MTKKNRAAGGTPATRALAAAGVAHTLVPYEHHEDATDFGAEAARETGADPRRVFKTLVVALGPRELAVAVVPVSARLDLKAAASALGAKKADLADPRAAERSSGYVVGGISPLGQRTPLPTVIDASARAFPTILISAGRRGLQVELAADDLALLTGAAFADVAR